MSCHYSHGHSELSVLSLEEYRVPISPVVRDELVSQFTTLYNDDDKEKKAGNHVDQLLMAMKEAPYPTICRCVDPSQVRRVTKDLSKVLDKWKQRQQQLLLRTTTHNHNTKQPPMITVQTSPHSWMEDVICVTVATRSTTTTTTTTTEKNTTPIATTTTATTTTTTTEKNANAKEEDTTELLFANWPKRAECGWPLTHRVVVCDRYCGEAVLRGSDIFVRGILCADTHIQRGETVQVYAHVSTNNKPHRGLVLQRYQQGTCVHLGTGIAACDRAHMFSQSQGLGVEMLAVNNGTTTTRTTMYHPPLHGVLEQDMMLQNLASLTVARALNVHNDDDDLVILDMCAAPGGKTSHVASLALPHLPRIVACDKSRRKILAARDLFQRHGFANHITPLALDTTKCCFPSTSTTNNNNNYDDEGGRYETVDEILNAAVPSEKDGLLRVQGFYPESFDRILLDPPCSALGLRPKLCLDASLDLKKYALYQKAFVDQAVRLLKPGGIMTYSTCTINAIENEQMVAHILGMCAEMRLMDVGVDLAGMGGPGLPGHGLNDTERNMVRRFDCVDHGSCMTGFFVAKLQKIDHSSPHHRKR